MEDNKNKDYIIKSLCENKAIEYPPNIVKDANGTVSIYSYLLALHHSNIFSNIGCTRDAYKHTVSVRRVRSGAHQC